MEDLNTEINPHRIFDHTLRVRGEEKGTANVSWNSGSLSSKFQN